MPWLRELFCTRSSSSFISLMRCFGMNHALLEFILRFVLYSSQCETSSSTMKNYSGALRHGSDKQIRPLMIEEWKSCKLSSWHHRFWEDFTPGKHLIKSQVHSFTQRNQQQDTTRPISFIFKPLFIKRKEAKPANKHSVIQKNCPC